MNTENFKKVVMFEMLMRRAFGPPFNEPHQAQILNAYRQFLNNTKDSSKKIDTSDRQIQVVLSFLGMAVQQFLEWPITVVEKEELLELLTGLEKPSCEGEVFFIVDELLVLTERLKRVSLVLKAA